METVPVKAVSKTVPAPAVVTEKFALELGDVPPANKDPVKLWRFVPEAEKVKDKWSPALKFPVWDVPSVLPESLINQLPLFTAVQPADACA